MPRPRPRPTAALVGLLVALVMSLVGATTAWAGVVVPDQDAAEQAAREIQAAQDRANAAAGAFLEAESELEVRTDEAARLEAEHDALVAQVDDLRAEVERAAVDRFASAGSAGIPLLTDYELPAERLQADALAAVVHEGVSDSFDQYAQARSDLEAKAAEVQEAREALAEQQETYDEARRQAEAEIVNLQEVETKRLADEQVRIALERQRREEEARRQAEEARRAEEARIQEERRQAEERAKAEEQRQADERRRADEAAQASAVAAVASASTTTSPAPDAGADDGSGGGNDSGGGADDGDSGGDSSGVSSGSGGSSSGASGDGGSSGAGGDGGSSGASGDGGSSGASGDGGSSGAGGDGGSSGGGGGGSSGGGGGGGGMVCPVQGASAYSDTYGAPRSGGRSHEGVDLIGATGTPLVAVVGGSAQFKQNRLGGNAVWLTGNNGTTYYYAHLSRFSGSSRGVSQGELIGYIGDTGNASGTPHLHFEVHPGGGSAVNPTPYVRAAGC